MNIQEEKTYVQCSCGNVFQVDQNTSEDDLYINTYCNCCQKICKTIYIGNGSILDKYLYYDSFSDPRYFEY